MVEFLASNRCPQCPRELDTLGRCLYHGLPEEVWYRFEDFRWAAPLDEYDEPVGNGRADVSLRRLPVIRHTPKGVVLDDYGRERRVCHGWRKKFAGETPEDAAEQFLARKVAQRRILTAKLDHVAEALEVFKKKFPEMV